MKTRRIGDVGRMEGEREKGGVLINVKYVVG
jgi:hypothetical protein